MQTERDGEIVRWLGRIGAASAEDVMGRFGMGRSWAYGRLSRLVRDGLLDQKTLLHRRPGLYIATAKGLRWTLQPRLGVYRVSAGGFAHAAELANVAVALHKALPQWGQLSERELRIAEGDEGKLLASVKLGELRRAPGASSPRPGADRSRQPSTRDRGRAVDQGPASPAGDLPRLRARPSFGRQFCSCE